MSYAVLIRRIDRFIEVIDNPFIILGLLSVFASASLLFIEVILRYFFDITFPLFEELSVNLVVWAVMFFSGPVCKRGSHVGMEFLAAKLHGRKRAIHQLVIDIVLLFVCIIFVWKGMELVQVIYQSGKTTNSGELKVWYMLLAVPVGGLIYGIYGVAEIIKLICVLIVPELSEQVFAHSQTIPSNEL